MYGRKYQWVIMGTYGADWFTKDARECAPSELTEALQGTILTDLLPLSTDQQTTVSGIVSVFFSFTFYYYFKEEKNHLLTTATTMAPRGQNQFFRVSIHILRAREAIKTL